MRDEDEVREEILRQEKGLPPQNVDRAEVPTPWAAEAAFHGLMKELNDGDDGINHAELEKKILNRQSIVPTQNIEIIPSSKSNSVCP